MNHADGIRVPPMTRAKTAQGRPTAGLGRATRWTSAVLAGLVTALFATAATAQQRVPPPSREAQIYSFAPIVKRAAPAVVNVYVRSRVRTFVSPFAGDPFFNELFGGRFGRPVERVQNSLGSGVIVTADGIVVTNAHVVKSSGDAEIRVVLSDKREFDAKVVLQDEKTDIAILRIAGNGTRFAFLEFDNSDALEVGDLVLAIGNPFGVGQTVTSGIISALARSEIAQSDAQVFIQTDAAINPGNSGGALIDMQGRLVGINTSIFTRSGGSHGIGFAIPSNLVRLYVDSAVTGRKVERPWIGARLEPVTREIAEALQLQRTSGAVVARVSGRSPAARAGLEPGDVIVAIEGIEVGDARAALYRFTTIGQGKRARLEVIRKGRPVALTIELEAPPPLGRSDLATLEGKHPLDGVTAANIRPAIIDRLGLDDEDGVAIVSVAEGSVARRLGLQAGDVIVEVGATAIDSLATLQQALETRQRFWQISIRRAGQLMQLRIGG